MWSIALAFVAGFYAGVLLMAMMAEAKLQDEAWRRESEELPEEVP